MKRNSTGKRFTPEEIAASIEAAPQEAVFDPENPPTAPEAWNNGFLTHSREELAEALHERRGRGPQRAPTKKLVSIRLARSSLAYFQSTGPGWQTRLDAALAEWIREHAKSD